MITSKLTSKAQTTIPQPVRAALRLKDGDEIAYAIEPGRVVLTRARPEHMADDPFVAFSEWDSPADIEAYGGL
jgi:antitoxin PrlF